MQRLAKELPELTVPLHHPPAPRPSSVFDSPHPRRG
jgi:hypothetical protein